MKKKPVLVTVQSVLCIVSAIALIVTDLIIYFQGLAAKEDDPMAQVYTTDAISDMAVIVCPLILAAIIVTVICAIRKVKDPAAGKPVNITGIRKNTVDENPSSTVIARWVILAVALIFIVIGIINGSITDVFIKASKICTECIGLG